MPEKTLRLLEERLKPAEPADPQRIRRLLTDLDSPKFSVREAASRELEQMASQPEPVERLLREALQKRPSLESRRRIEAILSLPQVARNPEYVRRITTDHPGTVVYALRLDRGLSPPEIFDTVPGAQWDQSSPVS